MVDVSECDREPIHIPGAIQPFGVLLALSEPKMVVTQVSDNASDHLSMAADDILGRDGARSVGRAIAHRRAVAREGHVVAIGRKCRGRGRREQAQR